MSPFLNLLPEGLQGVAEIASVLIAALVIWDLVSDGAKKAAILHTISIECTDLENRWRDLWSTVDREDSDEAVIRDRIRQLEEVGVRVTGRAGDADIREDQRLNEKSAETAYKVITDRHAS